MSFKPSIPKGTRDFGPIETAKRDYIFLTISNIFKLYGYAPIVTPAMEKQETLLGKYGEEGDRLIFKILNRGEKLDKAVQLVVNEGKSKNVLSEEALRYDLTVPFARYVVQHRNELVFPFKRYQIQPVWRADRPQKGRYREFYQCDIDVIGSDSLLNEVELIHVIDDVFTTLQLPVTIKLNNRKLLSGIATASGAQDKMTEMTIALDKLAKIGWTGVAMEMKKSGILDISISRLEKLFNSNVNLKEVADFIVDDEIGSKGLEEMQFVMNMIAEKKLKTAELVVDTTLARGLNYYTGAIVEVITESTNVSVLGGGRYDNLTGIFGLPNVSGVGISFGADRIYDALESLNLFPETVVHSSKVMFVNFGEKEAIYCLNLASELRENNIRTEVYPDADKMKKQMQYANAHKISFVVLAGSDEIKKGILTVKNMISGEQLAISPEKLIDFLQK